MQKSSVSRRTSKPKLPAKPRPDFPLFPHASGRWAKKVRGQFAYFGKVADDPTGEAALNKWLDQKDELLAGRKPRPKREGLMVRDLCNRFLNAKRPRLNTGELKLSTFHEYVRVSEKLVAAVGRRRLADDLSPADFEKLRERFSNGRGPIALSKDIVVTRMIFKYGVEAELLDRLPKYGPGFKQPSKKRLRESRQLAQQQNGKRMFDAAGLRKLIGAANVPLKAMILLGINCGFGQTDCAKLPVTAVDLDERWINFPRPKTAVERGCPLWPETVKAIRDAIDARPDPKDEADAGLCFLTRCGQRWVRNSNRKQQRWTDSVCLEFGKLLKAESLKRPGLNFYAIRHTFQTIGERSRDLPAVASIMGHADSSMAEKYREVVEDDRLLAVVQTVHGWLFRPDESSDGKGAGHE